MKCRLLLTSLYMSTTLCTLWVTPIWGMDNNNDIFDQMQEKKTKLEPRQYREKLDSTINFNFSQNILEISKNEPRSSSQPLIPFDSLPLNSPILPSLMKKELEELNKKILTIMEAELDVYELARRQLLKYQGREDKENILLAELCENLFPPEKLLRHRRQALQDNAPETPHDKRLNAIYINIKRINQCFFSHYHKDNIISALLEAKKAYVSFLEKVCTTDLKSRIALLSPRVRLMQEGGIPYLVPVELAREIIAKDVWGKTFKPNKEGQNVVVGKGGVHFKRGGASVSEIKPPFEWAAYSFASLLLGSHYIPPTTSFFLEEIPFLNLKKKYQNSLDGQKVRKRFIEEVRIRDKSITLENYFDKYPTDNEKIKIKLENSYVQASLTSGETSLNKFLMRRYYEYSTYSPTLQNLQNKFNISKELDTKISEDLEVKTHNDFSFSSLIFHSTDTKIDNLPEDLDINTYSGFFILSLILNFTDAKDDNLRLSDGNKLVSIDNDRVFGNMIVNKDGEHFIEAKNILFLMKRELDKSVDLKTRKIIVETNIDKLLLKWLKLCTFKNRHYRDLYQNCSFPKESQHFICFNPGTVLQLKERFLNIQKIFEEFKKLSHRSLFKKFHPIAYQYYNILTKKYPKYPFKAQETLWKKLLSLEKVLEKKFEKGNQPYPPEGEYKIKRTALPQDEAISLISTLDISQNTKDLKLFKGYSKRSVKLIKEKLENYSETYNLSDFEILKKMLTLPIFDPLDLSRSDLKNDDLYLFFDYLRQLKKISISHNQDINEEGLEIFFTHPTLTEIDFTGSIPLKGKTWTKLIESLRLSSIQSVLISHPINDKKEAVKINPYSGKVLRKVINKEGELMLKRIEADSFLPLKNSFSPNKRLDTIKEIICMLRENGIKFDVKNSVEQYCLGRLYSKTSTWRYCINWLPTFFNTSWAGSYKPDFSKHEDDKKALKWFKRSEKNENPPSETFYCLGIMYLYGEGGLDKNPSKAKEYFFKAGERGNTLNVKIYTSLYELLYKPPAENK